MKRLLHFAALALAALLTAGSTARADINWTYDWDRTPPAILAGTGGVSFTNEPTKVAANSSDVVATNLKVFSTALPSAPDTLGAGQKYTLTLTIVDTASGKSGTLTVTGILTGKFSASSSNLFNTFTSPITQVLNLGANTYTVTMYPMSPPGPPTASQLGSISAHVDVSTASVGGKTPEPTSMLLCLVGASVMGASSWRKRRRVLAAA